jgi:acyl-CoA dehydrogenase
MGIHGNATCVMNYDEATGYLIGEECTRAEGHVRDDERSPPRRRAAGPGDGRNRLSERRCLCPRTAAGPLAVRPKEPEKKADPIIVHPDVRRTLMTIRAFNEAGRAFMLWTALKSDVAHKSEVEKTGNRPTTC